jgi:anti-sigma regulatory factor (Ser/Thr protein kinase)
MPGADKWETIIPNQLSPLMRAIEALDACLERWGANADARYLAQLAVEELGTNIIKYGYDDQQEHAIHLSAAPEEEVFRIGLEDDGHEFNPCLTPEPDPNLGIEERTPGGWGLSLVRRLTVMEYERRGDRNVVCIQVPRQPPSLDS